ncbi:hypothetical protein MUK42_34507 [Musa troglodytarum]|uniref:Uncharacterized protein n=1 Tax=Musa troglodytarum TaxID=320322 RepID=A0A9E7HMW9_9LILI|nr:hypothetical protein MUK42_34507 [Musa troglodytarum]
MDDRVRQEGRVPLKEVVADGTRRWFQDALKEARVGDVAMQVLVGQMHHSGYGVLKNDQKVRLMLGLPKRQSTVHQFRRLATSIQDVYVSLAKLEEAYKLRNKPKQQSGKQFLLFFFRLYTKFLERSGSVRATRFRPDPGRTGPPVRTGPSRARPSRAGPSRSGPSRAERSRAEPNGAEPGRSSRPCRAGPFKNCNGPGRRFIPVLSGTGQNRVCPTRLGPAQLGAARLGSAPPGSARLGPARLGSVRLVSARPGPARLGSAPVAGAFRMPTMPRTRLIPPPPGRGIVGVRNAPARARARVHPPSLFARLHFERSICSPTSPSKTTSSWF